MSTERSVPLELHMLSEVADLTQRLNREARSALSPCASGFGSCRGRRIGWCTKTERCCRTSVREQAKQPVLLDMRFAPLLLEACGPTLPPKGLAGWGVRRLALLLRLSPRRRRANGVPIVLVVAGFRTRNVHSPRRASRSQTSALTPTRMKHVQP